MLQFLLALRKPFSAGGAKSSRECTTPELYAAEYGPLYILPVSVFL